MQGSGSSLGREYDNLCEPHLTMRINSIIDRYIFKEMLAPFSISVLFFALVFIMMEMLKIANWVVNYNISLWVVILMIGYACPYLLVFVLPMSTMMAILLTFLRLSNDNEITALKSGGVSFYRLLPPVFLFSLFGFFFDEFYDFSRRSLGKCFT